MLPWASQSSSHLARLRQSSHEGAQMLPVPHGTFGARQGGRATTRLPRRVLRRVLETAFKKVLRRVLRRCLSVGFTGMRGSKKGS